MHCFNTLRNHLFILTVTIKSAPYNIKYPLKKKKVLNILDSDCQNAILYTKLLIQHAVLTFFLSHKIHLVGWVCTLCRMGWGLLQKAPCAAVPRLLLQCCKTRICLPVEVSVLVRSEHAPRALSPLPQLECSTMFWVRRCLKSPAVPGWWGGPAAQCLLGQDEHSQRTTGSAVRPQRKQNSRY